MNTALAELMRNPLLWRGDQLARIDDVVATGFASLDRELPGGGWPQGAITELLLDRSGIGEMRLLLPSLHQLASAGAGVALVNPPHLPYAPAFASAGIDPATITVVESRDDKNGWWASEQILRADDTGAVLFWARDLNDAQV